MNSSQDLLVGRLDIDVLRNTAAHASRLAEISRAYSQRCSVMRLRALQHSSAAAASKHPVVSTDDDTQLLALLKNKEKCIHEETVRYSRRLRSLGSAVDSWLVPSATNSNPNGTSAHAHHSSEAAGCSRRSGPNCIPPLGGGYSEISSNKIGGDGRQGGGDVSGAREEGQSRRGADAGNDAFAACEFQAHQEKISRLVSRSHLEIHQHLQRSATDGGGDVREGADASRETMLAAEAVTVAQVLARVQCVSNELAHSLVDTNRRIQEVQAQKEEEDLLADETRALNAVFSQHVAELKRSQNVAELKDDLAGDDGLARELDSLQAANMGLMQRLSLIIDQHFDDAEDDSRGDEDECREEKEGEEWIRHNQEPGVSGAVRGGAGGVRRNAGVGDDRERDGGRMEGGRTEELEGKRRDGHRHGGVVGDQGRVKEAEEGGIRARRSLKNLLSEVMGRSLHADPAERYVEETQEEWDEQHVEVLLRAGIVVSSVTGPRRIKMVDFF